MNQLAKFETDPRSLIETLLQNDPRLISKHTTRQYKSDLLNFEEWRAARPFTKTLVEAYAAQLQGGGYAPNTINQRLAAIRWYARKLSDLAQDYGTDSDLADLYAKHAARVAAVQDVRGERPETGRHIEQGELQALINACTSDPSPAGTRDAAIIALAWCTGLRRDEIARIELADLTNQQKDSLDLTVTGKGGKVRSVYVFDGALSALVDWLKIRGNEPGALFQRINKAGNVTGGRLSGEALRKIFNKRIMQAALSDHATWHDFRRSFAGNLWGAGVDGVTIQKLMGHASQNQTARYDRRPEDARRQAVKVLHVPYTRKA